jgi:hypothetical protein
MKERDNVRDLCVRVNGVVHKMISLSELISQQHVIHIVLRSLTLIWNTIAIIMEERKYLATLEYDELVGSLILHENRIRDTSTNINDKAFVTQLQISKNDSASSSNKNNKGSRRGQNQNYPRGTRGRRGSQGGLEVEASLMKGTSNVIIAIYMYILRKKVD